MAITFNTCCTLLLALFTLLEFGACDNLFKKVKSCPANEEQWKHRAQMKSCQDPTPDFICAAIKKHPGQFGENCIIKQFVLEGNLEHSPLKICVVLRTCILSYCTSGYGSKVY